MARALQWIGLVAGIGGLALQFALTLPAAMEAGRSLVSALVFYFSFFTILTNIAVVLTHAAGLGLAGNRMAWLQRPRIRAGTASAIALVGLIYFLILARLWQPHGWWLAADATLHYATPALFLAWWLLAGADGTTRWRDPLYWLAWPVLYVAYTLARAPIAGEVPYPFLDFAHNGWGDVAQAIVAIAALFVGLGCIAVATDHWIARIRASTARSTP